MKELASAVAVVLAVFGTAPYLVGTLRGRIKPHAITWFVWTVTTSIAFAGQLVGGGGVGAAPAGASAVIGVAITGHAYSRGDRSYTRLDRLCLAGALIALLSWALAGDPMVALILIALVDVIGAVPTIRKALAEPRQEGVSPFLLANVKWLLVLCALDRLNVLTLLFPATTSAVNTVIIAVVLIRRAQLRRSAFGERGPDARAAASASSF